MNVRTRFSSALAFVLLLVLFSSCGDEPKDEGTAGLDIANEVGHVHGIGKNPADGSVILATHNGMFKIRQGSTGPVRIAGRYQDTMAFTVVGADHFLGSGHPDGRDNLPPFLGLIETRDGAETWRAISLQGKVDFHLLEASDQTIYGYGSDFDSREVRFLASQNYGESWRTLEPPDQLIGLAIKEGDESALVAAGMQAIYGSSNGGRTWAQTSTRGGLLEWPGATSLYRVDLQGAVAVSANAGRDWTERGSVGVEPAAFTAVSTDELLVARHDGLIKRSTDRGATWQEWLP